MHNEFESAFKSCVRIRANPMHSIKIKNKYNMKNYLNHLFKVATLFAMTFLVSCAGATKQPLAGDIMLRGKKCVSATGLPPSFMTMTPAKALLSSGALGALLPSNRVANKSGVKDPAAWMGQQLGAGMQARHGLIYQGHREVVEDSPSVIANACKDVDFVLDVRTMGWGFTYFPVSWGKYRVVSSVKLRLIDCKSGQVIASGTHSVVPGKQPDSPSYDKLTQGNAERLKLELQKNAALTTEYFKSEILRF